MQPEVGLAGPGAPALGARGVLPFYAHRWALQRAVLSGIGVAVRQVVEGGG